MKFAIVDDQKYFIDSLKAVISNISSLEEDTVVDSYYTGEEIVKKYRAERMDYDIIFMDIELGGIDGIDVSRRLRSLGFEKAIVFATSHTEFDMVQQSHDVDALYYFKKPITEQNIIFCMEKLSAEKKFVYNCNGHAVIIPYKKILYFEASRNYMQICALDPGTKAPRYRANIASVAAQLPPNFVQCHRSYIVNLSYAVTLEESQIYMHNLETMTIPVSDKFREAVYSAFYEL